MIPDLAEPGCMHEVWRCSVLSKDQWQSIDILEIKCGVMNPSYADLPTDKAVCMVHLSLLPRGFTILSSGPQPQTDLLFLWLFWMAIAVLVLDSCCHLTLFLHSQFYWISFHSSYVFDISPHFIHHFCSLSVVLLDNFWYYRLFQFFFLWFNL